MNYRILLKAMSFMFLPTLAVLLLLLVGFLDPVAMWNYIKSDAGGAIFLRFFILIAEIVLVIVMYQHYSFEEFEKDPLKDDKSRRYTTVNGYTDIKDVFNSSGNKTYKCSKIGSNHIIIKMED